MVAKVFAQGDLVAVVGAGAMGAGIAHVAAAAGHTVLLYDQKEGAAAEGVTGIDRRLKNSVKKGKVSEAYREQVLGRLVPVSTLESLASADLVIEAIIENLDIKKTLFAKLEELVSDSAILATNTSSFSVTALAAGMKSPERVVGMHFFNPAPLMKLVEIISGQQTSEDVADIVFSAAYLWGKRPVKAKSTPGFIVNRVARPYYYEAFRAWEEGAASPAVIDCALKVSGGFRMGPFELTDLIGQDVNSAVSRSIFDAYSHQVRFAPSLFQEELVAAGKLGRKTGHSIYNEDASLYAEGLCDAPVNSVAISDEAGAAEPIFDLLKESGVDLIEDNTLPIGVISCGGIFLALTDGRTATNRAQLLGRPVVLFDYATDYGTAEIIFIALADQATPEDKSAAVAFFQKLEKRVIIIDDHPGMLAMRTIASLCNVAADAARDKVATPADIDTAMIYGVNYPSGPLAWADKIGASHVCSTLQNLAEATGESKYSPSQYIARRIAAGGSLAA